MKKKYSKRNLNRNKTIWSIANLTRLAHPAKGCIRLGVKELHCNSRSCKNSLGERFCQQNNCLTYCICTSGKKKAIIFITKLKTPWLGFFYKLTQQEKGIWNHYTKGNILVRTNTKHDPIQTWWRQQHRALGLFLFFFRPDFMRRWTEQNKVPSWLRKMIIQLPEWPSQSPDHNQDEGLWKT